MSTVSTFSAYNFKFCFHFNSNSLNFQIFQIHVLWIIIFELFLLSFIGNSHIDSIDCHQRTVNERLDNFPPFVSKQFWRNWNKSKLLFVSKREMVRDGGIYLMINSRVKFQFESISCSLTICTYDLVMKCIQERARSKAKSNNPTTKTVSNLTHDFLLCSAHGMVFLMSESTTADTITKLRKAFFMHFHFTATKCCQLLENLERTFFIGCSSKVFS